MGQPFLRTYRCAIRFGLKALFFEICHGNQTFKISRPYAETACQFPHSVNLISASQLNPTPNQCIFKAYISMIQREYKVQEDVHPLLRFVLDKYPAVISGIPPDGKISRDSHCTIDLMPGSTPKMLRSYRLTPLGKFGSTVICVDPVTYMTLRTSRRMIGPWPLRSGPDSTAEEILAARDIIKAVNTGDVTNFLVDSCYVWKINLM